MSKLNTNFIAIVGGMGPLASSRFINTVYKIHASKYDHEQNQPNFILYSLPQAIADRTELLNYNNQHILRDQLLNVLEYIPIHSCQKIIITCFTMHTIFNDLPHVYIKKCISLVDLLMSQINSIKKPSLLLCTNGFYKFGIPELIQSHHSWQALERYIIIPNENDQNKVHELIYQLKKGASCKFCIGEIERLMTKYQAQFWLACCTELHLLTAKLYFSSSFLGIINNFIDPLFYLAKNIEKINIEVSQISELFICDV